MRSYLSDEFMLDKEQLEQFEAYYRYLIEKNKVMNLTAITDKQEVYIKHFFDSLTISQVIEMRDMEKLLDVGTGAGFPGIPLKIAFPHLKLTLLDSLQKRISFLQEVGEMFGWKDVVYIHGRAEDIAQLVEHREQYDIVTSRAVAKLNVLAEYCLPFVRLGGNFAAMKGADVEQEAITAKQAIFILGRSDKEIHSLTLPEKMGERNIVVMKKRQTTPKKYPRKASLIKKSPL